MLPSTLFHCILIQSSCGPSIYGSALHFEGHILLLQVKYQVVTREEFVRRSSAAAAACEIQPLGHSYEATTELSLHSVLVQPRPSSRAPRMAVTNMHASEYRRLVIHSVASVVAPQPLNQ